MRRATPSSEADLALDGFTGTLGLAHHVAGEERHGLLEVPSPSGLFALATRREGGDEIHDEKTLPLPDGAFRLAVSASGRHLSGLLDGKLIVHGHTAPLPGGACGLLLVGNGALRILSITVTPLAAGGG